MFQAHVFISGFVQGVGFRQFVRSEAKRLGITGWVKNLPDGRVEALVQSDKKETIEELVRLCNKGPFMSEVKNIVVEWEESHELFEEFAICQ